VRLSTLRVTLREGSSISPTDLGRAQTIRDNRSAARSKYRIQNCSMCALGSTVRRAGTGTHSGQATLGEPLQPLNVVYEPPRLGFLLGTSG
jgi:hypothetical protein